MNIEAISPFICNNNDPNDYFYTNFSSNSSVQYLDNGEPHKIMFNLAEDYEYVLCIDISTTSLGLVIGNIEERKPMWLVNMTRNNVTEADYTSFIDNFMIFLNYTLNKYNNLIDGKIIAVKCEQPFFNPHSNKGSLESYNALKQVFNRIRSAVETKGIRFIPSPAPQWKSFYLTPVKQEFGIANISKSNKEYIRRRGEKFYKGLEKMANEDCFDALGLFLHYLTIDYDPSGIIRINNSYTRSLKNVRINFFTFRTTETKNHKSYDEILEQCKKSAAHLGENREIQQFSYCTTLTSKENIKACIGINENNIYFSIIPVTIPLITELYKHPGTVDSININSKIMVVGYRA